MKTVDCFLVSENDPVEVWQDGQFTGRRTPTFVEVPAGGELRLELRKDFHQTMKVVLEGTQEKSYFYFELERSPFVPFVINGELLEQSSKTQESEPRKFLRLL